MTNPIRTLELETEIPFWELRLTPTRPNPFWVHRPTHPLVHCYFICREYGIRLHNKKLGPVEANAYHRKRLELARASGVS